MFWPTKVSNEQTTPFLQGRHVSFTSVWQCRNKACKGIELHRPAVPLYSWTKQVVEEPHQLVIRCLPSPTSIGFPKELQQLWHTTMPDNCAAHPFFSPSQLIRCLCAEYAQKHPIGHKCVIKSIVLLDRPSLRTSVGSYAGQSSKPDKVNRGANMRHLMTSNDKQGAMGDRSEG